MTKRKMKKNKQLLGKNLVLAHKIFTGVLLQCGNSSLSENLNQEAFSLGLTNRQGGAKNHSVCQLGDFSSVKNQASQELDLLLVIKGFALQAVK